jgi:acylphosphatase
MQSRVQILIYGEVQGVFFRSNAQSEALSLGLSGWVKNNSDGTVELLAEGDIETLKKLLEWCRKGPGGAKVEKVEETWGMASGDLSGFSVIR